MIRPVFPILVKKLLALLPQSVHATLEIDQQTALVRDDEVLLGRRDHPCLVQRLRGEYVEIGEIGEVGEIGEQVLLQHGAVDAIDSLDTEGRVEYPVARGHHHVPTILVPYFPIRLHVYSSLALAEINLVTRQQDHVLVPCRYVDASTIAVVRCPDTLARTTVAIEQAVYVYAGYLAASARALHRWVGVVEYALERVRYVDAHPRGAVERACQIATLVRYAFRFLRVLLIDPVTGLVRCVGAVGQQYRGAVSTKVHVDLDARAGRFRQAPLPAAAPFTVVRVHGAYGRAHHWHLAYTRLERPGARHVDGHG